MTSIPADRLNAWLRLFRLPNLFTVPGDVIAGAAGAGMGLLGMETAWAACAVVFLYMGGLSLNDYADRSVDARERPDRPIPSGTISPGAALATGLLCLVLGVCAAYFGCGPRAGISAAAVAVLVNLYNAWAKRIPVIGPTVMGLCRGGAVLTGMMAVPGAFTRFSVAAPIVSTVYIMCVSLIAAHECEERKFSYALFTPPAVFAACAVLSFAFRGAGLPAVMAAVAFCVGLLVTGRCACTAVHGNIPVPAFIGCTIRTYVLVQAGLTFLLWPGITMIQGSMVAVLFAVLALCAHVASGFFYSS